MAKRIESRIESRVVNVPSRFAVYNIDATMPQEGISEALNFIATARPGYRMELHSINFVPGKGMLAVVEYNKEEQVS